MGESKTKQKTPEQDLVVEAIGDLMQASSDLDQVLKIEEAAKRLEGNLWLSRFFLVASSLSPNKKGDVISYPRDHLMRLIQMPPSKRELFYYYMKRMRSLGVGYPKKVGEKDTRFFIKSRDHFQDELLTVAAGVHKLSNMEEFK